MPAPEKSASNQPESAVYLSIESGNKQGKVYRVPVPGTIGRDPRATLRLDDSLVSNNHVRIDNDPVGHVAIDQGSMNGLVINGQRMEPYSPQPLASGDKFKVGNTLLRFDDQPPSQPPARERAAEGDAPASLRIAGTSYELTRETTAIGRDKGNTIRLEALEVSRNHCVIVRKDGQLYLRDSGSRHGTFLNEQRVPENKLVKLQHRDQIRIGEHRGVLGISRAPTQDRHEAAVTSAFRIDLGGTSDPLTANLRATVQHELDACIGCHECMRACPLPEAPVVSIGALNSYGMGSGTPTQATLDFVENCTQCHACVPVCPVDIHRSRIVLYNKLKATPDPDQNITLQVGSRQKRSKATVNDIANRFANHPILGTLGEAERIRLFAGARYRSLIDQEEFASEGTYLDSVWFLIEGRVAVGMATSRTQFPEVGPAKSRPGRRGSRRIVRSTKRSQRSGVRQSDRHGSLQVRVAVRHVAGQEVQASI